MEYPEGAVRDAYGNLWILPGFKLEADTWEWYDSVSRHWKRSTGGLVSDTQAYKIRIPVPAAPEPPVKGLDFAARNWWGQGWRAGYEAAMMGSH